MLSHNQQGRTLVEVIGILAIMALITIAGIRGFGWMTQGAVADNVGKAVVARAMDRQNELEGRNWRLPDVEDPVDIMGPHDMPIRIYNGIDGTIKDAFMVTLGNNAKPVSLTLCQQLLQQKTKLQEAKLDLLAVTVNGNLTENCEEENILEYTFKKKVGRVLGNIIVTPFIPHPVNPDEPIQCPKRRCPTGAKCTNTAITCVPGYYTINAGTCNLSCQKCPENTYRGESDDPSACISCGSGQTTNFARTTCVCLTKGMPCKIDDNTNGYAGGKDDCFCYPCIETKHCPTGYVCQNKACVPGNNCPDGKVSDGSGGCVVCTQDSDCKICYTCAPDGNSCNHMTRGSQDERAPGKFCDGNGNAVECLGGYGSGEGACPEKKPWCDGGVCKPCPRETPVYDTNQQRCICPTNADCDPNKQSPSILTCDAGYYRSNDVCLPCLENTFSPAGATSCIDCGDGQRNANHTACTCNDNAIKKSNGSCSICPAGQYKKDATTCAECTGNTISKAGSTQCSDCGAGTANTGNTNCNCGAHASQNSSTLLCSCDTPYELNKTSHTCYCPQNYYLKNGVCTACPNGASTSSINATSCTCPNSNTHDTSTNVCYCPKNYYLKNGTCTACPNGASTSSTNATSCTCPAGSEFSNNTCAACTGNKISKAGGSCVDCGAGTPNSTRTDCNCDSHATHNNSTLLCSCNNTFNFDNTNHTCYCATNYYLNGNSCTSCPSGGTKGPGNTTYCTCTTTETYDCSFAYHDQGNCNRHCPNSCSRIDHYCREDGHHGEKHNAYWCSTNCTRQTQYNCTQ